MKTTTIFLASLCFLLFALTTSSCSLFQNKRTCAIDQSSFYFVKCWGKCPAKGDKCYLKWRKKGSEDEWTKSGTTTRDRDEERDAGLEYACYCD